MVEVVQSFKDNLQEVEDYFKFLERIESGFTSLADGSGGQYLINVDLSRILKANTFLILYNLIESTIKSGLWETFERIKADKVIYDALIKEIQLLWIDHKIKLEFRSNEDTVNASILKVIKLALEDSVTYYQHKHQLKFDAGSLDIKGISETFKRHGIAALPVHDLIKDSFKTTRVNRNNLAHGDMTFKECGKDYSFRDLRIIKCHTVRYLMQCIFSIKAFIENQSYIAQAAAG